MAVIVLNGQTEGFKHLDFVTIPEIGAAVAALLTAGQGLERQAKLQMEGAVTERLLGHRAHLEQFEGKKFAALPRIGIAAVEEHQRTFRGLGQECRRLPDDPFRTELLTFFILADEFARDDLALPFFTFEDHLVALAQGIHFGHLFHVRRGSREPVPAPFLEISMPRTMMPKTITPRMK